MVSVPAAYGSVERACYAVYSTHTSFRRNLTAHVALATAPYRRRAHASYWDTVRKVIKNTDKITRELYAELQTNYAEIGHIKLEIRICPMTVKGGTKNCNIIVNKVE